MKNIKAFLASISVLSVIIYGIWLNINSAYEDGKIIICSVKNHRHCWTVDMDSNPLGFWVGVIIALVCLLLFIFILFLVLSDLFRKKIADFTEVTIQTSCSNCDKKGYIIGEENTPYLVSCTDCHNEYLFKNNSEIVSDTPSKVKLQYYKLRNSNKAVK